MNHGQTTVDISGVRLNEIYISEDLDQTDKSSHSHLNIWCHDNCESLWRSHIYLGFVSWVFDDADDAMLFKLTWA